MNAATTDPAPEPRAPTSRRSTGTLGRYFSYFSHRVFVAYRPADLHRYLTNLFDVRPEPDTADERDAEILRWTLLHRARLNPLLLNREIEALRGDDDSLLVPRGMAEILQNRIDVTLQFAVELALARPELDAWVERRPRMRQTLLDAAYYVSACFERDQSRQDGTRAIDELDMGSDDGRAAFRDYLVHRMNLYANESPPADEQAKALWEQERKAIEAGALGEQDVRRLYEVARDVAHTAACETNPSSLKARWAEAARKQPHAMSAPSEDLYPALLLGPGDHARILRPIDRSDPDCRRYRWLYFPSGEESLDRRRKDVFDESGPWVQRWMDLDGRLNLAALGRADSIVDDQDMLRRMIEDYALMRSPDRWSTLVGAAHALKAPRSERKVAELELSLQRLREFVQKADDPFVVESVWRALVCAAAVEGLAGKPGRSAGLADGLDALKRGLRFDRCQPEEAARRLRTLQASIRALVGGALPAVPETGAAWPPAQTLQQQVEQAFQAGSADTTPVDDEEYWLAVTERVQASQPRSATSEPAVATLSEIRGWLGREPDQRLVDLDLYGMTLRRWSAVLRHSLQGSVRVPPWIAAHALERLGARSLDADAQQHLMDQLHGTTRRFRDTARSLWAGQGQQHQALLVVSTAATSVTDAWDVPPDAGLVIVATAEESVQILDRGLDQAIGAFPTPLLQAIEQPSPSPEETDGLASHIASRIGGSNLIFVYREGQMGKKSPKATAPRSAAELWAGFSSAP